jgi:Transposase
MPNYESRLNREEEWPYPYKYFSDKLVSVGKEGRHPTRTVQRGTNHCDPEGGGGRSEGGELCRRHGISSATFCNWRSKYGGLEISEMRRLRQLEEENPRLKAL